MKSARELISAMFDARTAAVAARYSSLFTGWSAVAGEDVAAHSKVTNIKNGVLFVEVDHPGWIQMIRLEEKKILSRIAQRHSGVAIRSLRIVTDGGDSSSRTHSTRKQPPDPKSEEPLRNVDSEQYREFHSLLERLRRLK